jgi:hypothetical protein
MLQKRLLRTVELLRMAHYRSSKSVREKMQLRGTTAKGSSKITPNPLIHIKNI